jgi:glucokinase
MKKFSIGIDIGGTNTDIGLVNEIGVVIDRVRLLTASYSTTDSYMNNMMMSIQKLIEENCAYNLAGIGIGAPNGNFYTGCIENAVNLNFKETLNLRETFSKKLNLFVVVTNDANAAAYGEMIYGGAKWMKHFIMVTLGTGVGSGIVSDGKVLYGFDGNAGELGHISIFPEGRSCNCGKKGCLERYVSAGGIKHTYLEMAEALDQKLANKTISCKEIAQLALEGDKTAMNTFDITGNILGRTLANAVTFTAPEAIFLMGGPVKAGKALLEPLQKSFDENLLFVYKGKVKIITSLLKENDAAILGAAALAVHESQFAS